MISGTTVVGGTKKGRSDRETSPMPKPVKPNTKLATANIQAPTTQVMLTQGSLRKLSHLPAPCPPMRAQGAEYSCRWDIVLVLLEQHQVLEGVAFTPLPL